MRIKIVKRICYGNSLEVRSWEKAVAQKFQTRFKILVLKIPLKIS